LPDTPVADVVAVDQLLDGAAPAEHGGPQRRRGAGWEVAHVVQHLPGQLPGELATAGVIAAFEGQAVVAGLPHVVQERLGCQVGQGDALCRQRRGGVEQRRTVVQRMHGGVLDALPELLQQRVALGGEEPFAVAQEPGGPQRLQRGPDHTEAEQAGGADADLVALLLLAFHRGDGASPLVETAGLPALLLSGTGEAGQVLQQEPGAARPAPHSVGAARPDTAHNLLDLLDPDFGQVAVRHRDDSRLCRLAP